MTRASSPVAALPAGHPSLRAVLSEAIGQLITTEANREVGRWIGRKGEVVPARGDDPDAWPISELQILAQHSRPVADALRAYVNGEEIRRGEAIAVTAELLKDVCASGSFVARATAALSDGNVTDAEATDLLLAIHERRDQEDKALIPALTACARES